MEINFRVVCYKQLEMLTVSEDNYQLEFSARYSGDVHDEATTERY